ncbi:hypothetical protein HPB48_008444 [Haemaphysalis longicornis]|uniref:Uncharacterized protein n=1 Tax=Haemaphysalis longicornis TaxID=44386 RepID=A0A9J6H2I1_HAELO|nr:hypothetical protein HPB48_008444 [Haemaphysalis longicornis]
MLTTPDNPYASLGKLRHRRPAYASVLSGNFWLEGTRVKAVLKKPTVKATPRNPGYRRWSPAQHRTAARASLSPGKCIAQTGVTVAGPLQSRLELELRNVRGRANAQLAWKSYAIHTYWLAQESVATFDLTSNAFPPLWFSRVKSFTQVSESPL